MDFSCIYVNFNSVSWLEKSLQTLFQTEPIAHVSYEVIVVNNDQKEEALLQALSKRYPFKVLSGEENKGFGSAGNRGARAAAGTVLFFINPDTEWKKSFFQDAKKAFEAESSLGVLGVPLCNGGATVPNGGKFLTFFQSFANHLPVPQASSPEWVSGAALFIPKKLFLELGGFDERFFLYFEDMDLCKRVVERKKMVRLLEGAELIHHGGKSHEKRRLQKSYYDDSLKLYVRKHWNKALARIFSGLLTLYRIFFPYGR